MRSPTTAITEILSLLKKSLAAQNGIHQLADHLFRHESGRLISLLVRILGSDNLELAEDVVQDSLVEAITHWSYQGVPDNPSAWLFRVAKNKALNILNREKYKKHYAADTAHLPEEEDSTRSASYFSEQEILDDQLRMIFTCCHPSISVDSQVALALKTLCGFSVSEIARAYLTNDENVKKRLMRARQTIREHRIPFDVPAVAELDSRLQTVLETIYLLFNEGYSASTGEDIIRHDLCEEAIRLTELMTRHPALKDKSDVFALLALMQLNASRFQARQDRDGNLLTLEQQDRSLWDHELISEGLANLHKSFRTGDTSIYQLLAAISANHCSALDFGSTNWAAILSFYDQLIQIDSSPVVLLNRAIALEKVRGSVAALAELEKLKDNSQLKHYHLFYSTRAEFYLHLGQFADSLRCLQTALELTSNEGERRLLRSKIDFCSRELN